MTTAVGRHGHLVVPDVHAGDFGLVEVFHAVPLGGRDQILVDLRTQEVTFAVERQARRYQLVAVVRRDRLAWLVVREADGVFDTARRRDVVDDVVRVAEVLNLRNAVILPENPHPHRTLREHRFADGEPWMRPGFEHHHVEAAFSQNHGREGRRHPGAADDDVVGVGRR
ncbi:hypothetical protein [Haloferax sp. ATB1]|uniref:hypothetical protein n=1 Tax=Haloferax sp. ATB1 TaxID=1508454 RepID=UPI0031B61C15